MKNLSYLFGSISVVADSTEVFGPEWLHSTALGTYDP